jgi:gliding motility-associated-like protein
MYEIIPEISGNPANVTYEWSTGDTSPTLVVDVSGTYDLTITVGACTVTDSIDVFISDPITVEVTDDFRTCPGMLQTITATASDENASYQWLLNGEPISGANAAAYEFTIAEGTSGIQTYTVVATVGDCSGENDVIVELYDIGNCVISEGLSPDGSPGMNDSLDLEFLSDRTGGITKLQIFNRLGALIFEQGNYINEWAGQDKNGNELPTGTYYYVIDFVNPDDVYGPQASGWIYLNRASN